MKKLKSKYKTKISYWICNDCQCEFTEPEDYKELIKNRRCPYCGRKNMTHFKEEKRSNNLKINSKKTIF